MSQEPAGERSELEALRTRVEEALRDPMEEQWEEVVEQGSGGASARREAVRTHVAGLRDHVLNVLLEIDTLEGLKRGVAVQYVEVKCHWVGLNARLRHQGAGGGGDDALLYRATCVGLLLQALESLVDREHVEELADVLVEPIG